MAISMLHGRVYSKACGAMKCYTWDGKTKYKVTESAEEEKERLANWEKFLKEGEEEEEQKRATSATSTTTTTATNDSPTASTTAPDTVSTTTTTEEAS